MGKNTQPEEKTQEFENLQVGESVIYADATGEQFDATILGKHAGDRLDLLVSHPGGDYSKGTVPCAEADDAKEAWFFIEAE
jgi:hypothetical protein